jgi:hypothetical protein
LFFTYQCGKETKQGVPMWQKNKIMCTYSSGPSELATPMALHVVDVLELLKASPMAYPSNAHACVISKCLIYHSKVGFFFQNGTLPSNFTINNFEGYLCNHHTYLFQKRITHMQKKFLRAHQLRSTTSQNTTKHEANYDNLLSQCNLIIFIKCIVEK